MRRLETLQLGRAVAVLSVLVFHLTGLSTEYQHGCFYFPWTQVLRAGVDVFFVISGVVMVVTTYGRLEQEGTGARFLVNRVSRIYPPYLFLTTILAVIWVVHPGGINSTTGVDLFSSFTLWPSVNRLPLVQVGWTLSFEMMFYLAFFIIIIIHVKRIWFPWALIAWSFAVVVGSIAITLDSSGMLLKLFPRASFVFSIYVLEFVAGCLIGLAFLKAKFPGGRISVVLAVAIFTVEAAVFQATNFNGNGRMTFRVLLFGPPATLLVYGLLALGGRSSLLHLPRWAVRCGDMSYSIYLVHLLVLHFAYRYTWRVFNHTGTRPLFMVFAGCLAILASVIFYKLIEKPFCRWTRLRLEEIFKLPAKISIAPPVADSGF